MAGKIPGPLEQRGVSDRAVRVAIGDLASPQPGLPSQQLGYGRYQVGVQHGVSPGR